MTEDRVPTHRPRFDPWVGCVCGNNHRLTDPLWSEQPAPPLNVERLEAAWEQQKPAGFQHAAWCNLWNLNMDHEGLCEGDQ